MKTLGSILQAIGGFSLVMTGLRLWRVGFPRLEGPEGETWAMVFSILAPYLIMGLISLGILGLGNYLASHPVNTKAELTPAELEAQIQLEKDKVLQSPLIQEERVVKLYQSSLAAWSSGKLDSLNPKFKTDSDAMQLADFIKKYPPYKGSVLEVLFENYQPIEGEYLIGLGNLITDNNRPWFILTNFRLIQKDGITNQFREIALADIDSFRFKKKMTDTLLFKLKSGEEITFEKTLFHPKEAFLSWAISHTTAA